MGFKAEIKRMRSRMQLKAVRQPEFTQGYLKALDDIDELYTDLTARRR